MIHFALKIYSITDEDRLKQIQEEEAASLRLIQQLEQEEVQAMRERKKREDEDRQFARMIASALNKPVPTEPVIDPSDCVVSYRLLLLGFYSGFSYYIFNVSIYLLSFIFM